MAADASTRLRRRRRRKALFDESLPPFRIFLEIRGEGDGGGWKGGEAPGARLAKLWEEFLSIRGLSYTPYDIESLTLRYFQWLREYRRTETDRQLRPTRK